MWGEKKKKKKKDKEIKVSRCWILCNHQSNICSSGFIERSRVKDRSLKKKTVKSDPTFIMAKAPTKPSSGISIDSIKRFKHLYSERENQIV